MSKILKHHEFHVVDVKNNTEHMPGTVKFADDLRVVDGYFQVFSLDDPDTIIGIRADNVDAYRLVPIFE
nr:MAG TPA: hypothetical protein [Caudoviricetes sp.]